MKRDNDDKEDFSVPSDVLDLVSQKPNSQVTKKRRIMNEEMVDQNIVDAMLNVTERSDLRSVLGVKDDLAIEVKWYIEYEDEENGNYWLDATVTKADTGKMHKFIDEDEFTYCPVVNIKYKDDEETKEVCFIGNNLLFDVDENSVVMWRNEGDDFDDDDSDVEDVNFVFGDFEELEKDVRDFIPKIFINVLSKFKTQYESLPFNVRREWDAHILIMKDKLVEKIINFFKLGQKIPGTIMTLSPSDLEKIFDECFEEIENI